MLWRVRTSLPDRPGALAALAQECGKAEVNILGLQVFPGVHSVVDELILRTPDEWCESDIAELVARSDGATVNAVRCDEAALTDQPTRYVEAARAVLTQPSSFPWVVATLFDAAPGTADADMDAMDLVVDEVAVQIHRAAPFTATEHARAEAMAGLVSDVLSREQPIFTSSPERRMGGSSAHESLEYAVTNAAVTALVDGRPVGHARLRAAGTEDPTTRPVDLEIDPVFRRRGIGTRLLTEICRLAASQGAEQVLLSASAGNQAVMPMVLAAGMRGRIRMAGDVLTVRITVTGLRRVGAS